MLKISYLLIAMIGGTSGWIAQHRDARPAPVAGRVQESPPAKVTPADGAELLDAFVQKQKDNSKSSNSPAKGSLSDRFNELSKTLPVSPDPAADFQKLLAEFLEKRGLPALMDALSGTGNLVNSLAPVIFRDLGKRVSLEEIEQIKENSPALFADYQAGQYLGKEWPVRRREELLAALDPKSAAHALPGIIGRMEGSTGGERILTKLKSGGFSREIKDAMASAPPP